MEVTVALTGVNDQTKEEVSVDTSGMDLDLNPFKAESKGMVVLLKRHKNIIIQSVKHG